MEKDELEIKEEYLTFLDELRISGQVNMFGAASWLMSTFPELSKSEARKVLVHWMKTYGDRHKEAKE